MIQERTRCWAKTRPGTGYCSSCSPTTASRSTAHAAWSVAGNRSPRQAITPNCSDKSTDADVSDRELTWHPPSRRLATKPAGDEDLVPAINWHSILATAHHEEHHD